MEKNKVNVPVPKGLDSIQQIEIAKAYSKAQMKEGFTIEGFCKDQHISTKTFYKYKENPAFTKYLGDLVTSLAPEDEMQAYEKMKQHVLKFADKEKPTLPEMKLFFDQFDYLREADRQKQMEKLGLNKSLSDSSVPEVSIEERKTILFAKLSK